MYLRSIFLYSLCTTSTFFPQLNVIYFQSISPYFCAEHVNTIGVKLRSHSANTMKGLCPVFLLLIPLLAVYGAPSTLGSEETVQTVFSQKPLRPISDASLHSASEWLNDAKKEILKEKKNLEKWFYRGIEYIKQDNLLCNLFSRSDHDLWLLTCISTYHR